MDKKLQEELNTNQQKKDFVKQQYSRTFNLSDLKTDTTQTFTFESPLNKKRSPFKHSEMSARSTLIQKNLPSRAFQDFDYDEIMKTSSSAAVRNKYRESLGVSKISELRTANTSMRSSVASNATSNLDFWDQARVSTTSFCGKNVPVNKNDTFKPAEQMKWDFNERTVNESNWEDGAMKAPEMSFGKYAQNFIGSNNVRDIYSKKSPVKKPRGPLIEITCNDTPFDTNGKSNLEKLIKNLDTPKTQIFLDKFGQTCNERLTSEKSETVVAEMSEMVDSLSFDERENVRMFNEIPEKDNSTPQIKINDVIREEKAGSSRGTKRRASLSNDITPKTTLDKCLRSKSPTVQSELRAVAASLLKPIIPPHRFIMPRSRSGERLTFGVPSPGKVSQEEYTALIKSSRADYSNVTKSPSSREYLTATSSINATGEKLSLPSYGLVSLSPSAYSRLNLSPDADVSQSGLKRTVSQMSNGSEFQGDFLPIKIKKNNKKLSWESVKLYQCVTKSITIQNGPQKKLSLRVRVQGTGFSVAPHDYIRMIPNEARTFDVKFAPTALGPSVGQLIFELATDAKCSMIIPLYAYGGHASIRIDGLQKGPIGPAFVTMGQVKMLNKVLQQQITLKNMGTLAGFVSLFFEKTKWSDFSLSESLSIEPSSLRLAPGESSLVDIYFKATKEEIRKIFTLNKEITIVGEICVISGDEPTRLRLLRNTDFVPPSLLKFIPKNLKHEAEFKQQLIPFKENLEGSRITLLTDHIKTHEIAVTINRSLDETLMSAAEFSMADDTSISFATFYETNDRFEPADAMDPVKEKTEMYESRFFRVIPAQIIFNRARDLPEVPKVIVIESTCADPLFTEAVSSRHDLVSAIKSCGQVQPGECVHISVTPKMKAFQNRIPNMLYISILIGNAKVDIPVMFVD